MNKKFFAVRFLFCVFAILLSSSVAAHMVEHKGVLKEYQWPTRITIDHFVTFVEAAPMWLNIFQVPEWKVQWRCCCFRRREKPFRIF